MRELKIFFIVAVVTLITYWGVEPLAHSVFHPHVDPADFKFSDLKPISSSSDVANGKAQFEANCISCHSAEKAGFPAVMDNATASASYGVVPPDLSNAGKIYDETFLANFIKHPAQTVLVSTYAIHKGEEKSKGLINEEKMKSDINAFTNKFASYPMPSFDWMSDKDVADIVAYLKSIATEKLSNKEVFENACQRCHAIRYDKVESFTDKATITKYMGSTPPDLSTMIRAKGEHYLETFINDPQKHLLGTSMPRVGLTQEAQEQVIAYIEEVGDPKKEERGSLGIYVLIYSLIFAILAYLWKVKIWRDLH